MREEPVTELVDVLARRAPVLDLLADGPREKRDLRDLLGVSRSTAYKARRELEELGLVRTEGGRVTLTQFGRLARRQYDGFLAGIERITAARPIIESVPDDATLPLALVVRGQQVCGERHAPERPLARFEVLAGDATHIKCVSPVAMPRYLSRIRERVSDDDLVVELVLEPGAVDRLDTDPDFRATLESDAVALYEHDAHLPYGLVILDDAAVAFVSYTDQGAVAGLAVSDDIDACAWATAAYERHRAAARELGADSATRGRN
ncbi:helix-turn-helix transcriptional regulator [Halomarina litorea]|uniref:helix-turn-helix transcriptional regulator n=1 Tax=Halomarina litorea TaxID=2961595 RepID=UPI0020C38CAC|nr:helix-turn-helix domain-containing protein [Halomarina sp. BCD28]